jgi:BioD-like phosphotransacetylase family protein
MTGENNPNADGHHGEKNGRSKITDGDRRQIALEYVPGKKNGHNGNCSELAQRYGLDMSRIRRIAQDPRWTS